MTQKEQLDAANEQVTDLQTKLTAAEGEAQKQKATAEGLQTKLSTAEADRDKFRADFDAEVSAHDVTKLKLAAEEKKDKDADTKAREQLAAKGIAPAAKDAPDKLQTLSEDPAALWESYLKADSITQAHMRAEHGKKLDNSAAAFDRAHAG